MLCFFSFFHSPVVISTGRMTQERLVEIQRKQQQQNIIFIAEIIYLFMKCFWLNALAHSKETKTKTMALTIR